MFPTSYAHFLDGFFEFLVLRVNVKKIPHNFRAFSRWSFS